MSQIAMAGTAWLLVWPAVLLGSALVSGLAILGLKPWLVRYALARPSARGLHRVPTPQGGGIAVLLAGAAGAGAGAIVLGVPQGEAVRLGIVLMAAAGLAGLGFVDDVHPLPALPRLLLQLLFMGIGVAMLPEGTRLFAWMPVGIERGLLVVAGTWFINLTNFMDGMDWITVTELVPITGCLALFWGVGVLPVTAGLIAFGLLGGLLGYAPFNRPPARLFLGDVGSLPLGFLVAYCLFCLAGRTEAGPGALAAAVMLPLYYIADSGVTLLWRLRRGEAVWKPHRSHFYQVAAVRIGPWAVLARIGVVNAVLVWLTVMALVSGNPFVVGIAFLLAVAVVSLLLFVLASGERSGADQ